MDLYNQEELFAETVLAAQNRADFVALELELSQPKFKEKDGSSSRRKIEPWCFPVSIIAFLVLLLICIPMFGNEKVPDDNGRDSHGELCNDTCRILFHPGYSEQENTRTETKPFTRWSELLTQAESTIDLLMVYSKCREPSHLKALSVAPAIRIRVILLLAQTEKDTDMASRLELQPDRENHPEIRTLTVNFQRPGLYPGLYSLPEMIVVDQAHFALSSSTMPLDHQEGSRVLGARNCSCSSLVPDLQRVFQTYWSQARSSVETSHPVGQNKLKERMTVPDPFDSAFSISMAMPFVASSSINVSTSSHNADQRMSSGLPTAFPYELLTNVEAICAVLQASREFLYISVVKYQPQLSPHEANTNSSDAAIRSTYWPVLDSALRAAFVSRPLNVRMLVLLESPTDRRFLRSLKALDGLNGNSFRIKIRNARSQETVNSTVHQQAFADNFVTTANAAHFGTSSWEGKSLTQLPGLGLTVLPPDFCQEHGHFCSVIRGHRELASLSPEKPAASGSRSAGSARAAAPLSQRHRSAKDQQKPSGYPSHGRSSSEIASQKLLIAQLKTLFETQWDRPDANEL